MHRRVSSLSFLAVAWLLMSCNGAPAFSVTLAPGSASIVRGEAFEVTINVDRAGVAGPVLLSLAGAPATRGFFTP